MAALEPRSLSDLKEIGGNTVGTVHIPPLSRAIERLLPGEIVEIRPRSADFCEQPLCGLPA